MTEWFIWTRKDRRPTSQKVIVAGPYPSMAAANARHYVAVKAVEDSVKDGACAWWWIWGVCEAPAGTLHAKLGVL